MRIPSSSSSSPKKFQKLKIFIISSISLSLFSSRRVEREKRVEGGGKAWQRKRRRRRKKTSHGHTTRRESPRMPGTVFFPCPPLHVLPSSRRGRAAGEQRRSAKKRKDWSAGANTAKHEAGSSSGGVVVVASCGSRSAAACPACVCYQFITAAHGLFPNTCLRNHDRP